MEELIAYPITFLAAALIAGITLLTGFGLGTMLMPIFALFFPIPVAVAATALVHLANNLFKVGLMRRYIDTSIALRFGLPAVVAAFGGAALLASMADDQVLTAWNLAGYTFEITSLKLFMGMLILVFASIDMAPALRIGGERRWLPLGGLLSGFFGGLSGHQGALRAAFLLPLHLPPERYAGTQAGIAIMVDGARLLVYGTAFLAGLTAGIETTGEWLLVGTATVGAFVGSWIGKSVVHKTTVGFVRALAGALLLLVGTALAAGIV